MAHRGDGGGATRPLPLAGGEGMRIRMLTSMVAADWSLASGEVVDRPDEVARAWIAAGIAEPVEDAPEFAMIKPPEAAVKRSARARRGEQ